MVVRHQNVANIFSELLGRPFVYAIPLGRVKGANRMTIECSLIPVNWEIMIINLSRPVVQ